MNETIVAKGLVKHLAEKYAQWGTSFTDGIIVHNKTQTADHGYTSGCATILWEEGPRDPKYDTPWTYDPDSELPRGYGPSTDTSTGWKRTAVGCCA